MREYSPDLVVQMLRKDYPEIESKILSRIDNEIPAKLDDMSYLPKIVDSFKCIKYANYNSWMNSVGEPRNEMIENRELLISVILMFYHPEKLMNLNKKAKYILTIDVAAELGCTNYVIRKTISDVIVAFKAYRQFRDEVYRVYELIKSEHNFFVFKN